MPPLATSVLNQGAIDLILAWITGSVTNYQTYADWQLSQFGSPNAPGSRPEEDADSDGASNELEYLTGTNPLLPGDGWGVRVAMVGANVQLQYSRIANRGFEVQWSTNPTDPNSWQPLDVPGNELVFALTNSDGLVQDAVTNAVSKFYRVRVLEP